MKRFLILLLLSLCLISCDDNNYRSGARIIYVYSASTLTDFQMMKALGYDTVIHYHNTVLMLDVIQQAGMKCIWSLANDQNTIPVHPAIIGYYLFDEPETRNITIAQQDALIAKVRPYGKPTYVCITQAVTKLVSSNFDVYMCDIYWSGDYWKDYAGLYATVPIMKNIYKDKPFIPVVGLFNGPEFPFSIEQLEFAKTFKTMGTGGDFATFIWDIDKMAGTDVANGIIDNPIYQSWALELNNN